MSFWKELLNKLRQDVEGVKVLADWLGGDGIAVEREHAIARAQACIHGNNGKVCPQNYIPRWWNLHDMAKDTVATSIRNQIELKDSIGMMLPDESEIGTCRVCGCNLPLKVWTPIEYLKEHLQPEQLQKYPAWCWQKQEAERQ